MAKKINIIIPNWNGRSFIGNCLDSLRKQTFQEIETVVVDNGSTDGSVEYIRSEYPEVRVIALDYNKGFAGGVNEGIRNTDGELVFLLNNDTVLDPNCIEALYRASLEFPQISFFASKMLFSKITGVTVFAGKISSMESPELKFYSEKKAAGVINSAGDSFGIDGFARNVGIGEPDRGQHDKEREVFGACAGAALYRRSLFEGIGIFDEDFFLILEDVDLDFRAQLLGHRCLYIPTALVYHEHSASIVKYSELQAYNTARNSLFVLIKNMPARLLILYLWRILRQRQRLAMDLIIHGCILPYAKGELAFTGRLFSFTAKRLQVQSMRRVTTSYIQSILTVPEG